jgi:hypothetical protein
MSRSEAVEQHFRTLFVICGAILSGVVLFGVVIFVLQSAGTLGPIEQVPSGAGLVLNLAALSVLVVAHFLPRTLPRPAREASLGEALAWHKKTVIVATALREGAALMALVGILLTGSWTPGIGVVGLAVLTILLGWPKEAQIEEYLRAWGP